MKCPACMAAELGTDSRDIKAQTDGVPATVSNVQGNYCAACGAFMPNQAQGDRYSAARRLAELGGKAPDMEEIARRSYE